MTGHARAPIPLLRLLAPTPAAQSLLAALQGQPLLRGVRPLHATLQQIGYDTAGHALASRGLALWVQGPLHGRAQPWTLELNRETANTGLLWRHLQSWQAPVPSTTAPWAAPPAWAHELRRRKLAGALQPLVTIELQRTQWQAPLADGTALTLRLDDGLACAGPLRLPYLELVLLAPGAAARQQALQLLDELADRCALLVCEHPPVWRALALAAAAGARSATAVALPDHLPLPQAASVVLGAAWQQLVANLALLPHSDDPEVVHQARVAWRRWRSAWQLLRRDLPAPPAAVDTARATLKTALAALGPLRDLDVARLHTLPQWAAAHLRGDLRRAGALHALCARLSDEAQAQRQRLRLALLQPTVTTALLALGRWIDALRQQPASDDPAPDALPPQARRHLRRLHRQLQQALADGREDPQRLHAARILAKRLRYALDVLASRLPRRRRTSWSRQARLLQDRLGAQRDWLRAAEIAAAHGAAPELVNGLRAAARAAWP